MAAEGVLPAAVADSITKLAMELLVEQFLGKGGRGASRLPTWLRKVYRRRHAEREAAAAVASVILTYITHVWSPSLAGSDQQPPYM